MNDSLPVGSIQSFCCFRDDPLRFVYVQTPFLTQKLENTLAFDEFHFDEMPPPSATDGIDGNDVRMVEHGCGSRFSFETLDSGWFLLNESFRKDFQRDNPPQPLMQRPVNRAHAAFADLLLEDIISNDLADERIVFCLDSD